MTQHAHDADAIAARRQAAPCLAARPFRAPEQAMNLRSGAAEGASALNANLRGPLAALALPIGTALLTDGIVI